MRSTLDCAVLIPPAHAQWAQAWLAEHADRLGRVRLWPVPLAGEPGGAVSGGQPPGAQVLARLGPVLQRYDACLLPVTPATLAWSRMALACARGAISVPLLALARELRAAAMQDLFDLGVQDFVHDRAGAEETAARLHALRRRASGAPGSGVTTPGVQAPGLPASGPIQGRAGPGVALAEPPSPYAACAALSPGGESHGQAGAEPPSFRSAKAQVVSAFERQYIREALARSAGNIAVASRAARKHRRAFWALMRKHRIDAAPYREAALAPQVPPGAGASRRCG
ncbi:hypothetical protein V8Z80_07455 [Orrella sp. JC864]|uniref:hypothetical protein n=1 Tax=Orrella sp. JC864 TaxID=3120298 RepID=UPI00300AF5FC